MTRHFFPSTYPNQRTGSKSNISSTMEQIWWSADRWGSAAFQSPTLPGGPGTVTLRCHPDVIKRPSPPPAGRQRGRLKRLLIYFLSCEGSSLPNTRTEGSFTTPRGGQRSLCVPRVTVAVRRCKSTDVAAASSLPWLHVSVACLPVG